MEDPTKTVPSASARMASGKRGLSDKSTGFSEYKTGTPKLAVKMTLLEPISSCYVRVKLNDALGVRGVDRKPLIIAELAGEPLLSLG